MNAQTYEIADIDGRNPRQVTLAQYRAEIDERVKASREIGDAWRRGDIMRCAAAQAAFRKQFG